MQRLSPMLPDFSTHALYKDYKKMTHPAHYHFCLKYKVAMFTQVLIAISVYSVLQLIDKQTL